MIVLDIETSGRDFVRNGVWQIAAIDLKSGKQFISEGRIDDEDEILMSADPRSIYPTKSVLDIVGKTENQLKDRKKQSQKELIQEFFKWLEDSDEKNFICQNPQFDWGFLTVKARKYGIKIPFHFRSFDIHSIAQARSPLVSRNCKGQKASCSSSAAMVKCLPLLPWVLALIAAASGNIDMPLSKAKIDMPS